LLRCLCRCVRVASDGGDTSAEEGLGLHADLKDAHASHIQEVSSLRLRYADEYALAGRAYVGDCCLTKEQTTHILIKIPPISFQNGHLALPLVGPLSKLDLFTKMVTLAGAILCVSRDTLHIFRASLPLHAVHVILFTIPFWSRRLSLLPGSARTP
jgi:hypothetical protein